MWAADPWGRYPYRWFEGTTWTALVFDGTTQYLDPYVTQVRLASDAAPSAAAPPIADAATEPTIPIPIDAGARAAATAPPTGVVPPMPPPSSLLAASMAASLASSPAPAAGPAPVAPPAAFAQPMNVVPTHVPDPSVSVPPATSSAPVPYLPERPGAPTPGSAQAEGAGRSRRTFVAGSSRQLWVPVGATLLVVGFAWWLFNLRGSSESSGAAIAEDSTATTVIAVDEPVATPVPVVTAVPPVPVAPSTTVPTATTTAVTVPVVAAASDALVQDCVDSALFGSFVGEEESLALWNAAGNDFGVLRSVCAALPELRLLQFTGRMDLLELQVTGTTMPRPAPLETVAPAAVAGDPVAADESVVAVSPTMPAPLPTTTSAP